MIKLSITRVEDNNKVTEQQGTKWKFWYGDESNLLFKEGKIHGENWAELIACQLANALELPHAIFKPAEYIDPQQKLVRGTVSELFVNKNAGERLIHANEFLAKTIKDYDKYQIFNHRQYTVSSSIGLFSVLRHLIKPSSHYEPIRQFVGYLLFDVFIANLDRHHENWGFISSANGLYLAPSYDHGSSLACRESEKTRNARLITKDKGYSIETFAKKANAAFYDGNKQLKSHAIADICIKIRKEDSRFWIEKIASISEQNLIDIIDSLPEDWMTELEKTFTLKFLIVNQQELVKKLSYV